jgi:hypothetical protein
MWQEEVNARGIRVGNVTYGVNVTTFDIGGIYGVTYNRTFKVARGDFGNYDFIFGMWSGSRLQSMEARSIDCFSAVFFFSSAGRNRPFPIA